MMRIASGNGGSIEGKKKKKKKKSVGAGNNGPVKSQSKGR
jgi:hypothetical protein